MTRDEAQAAWEKIVDVGFNNYSSLTREQRVWFNLEPLTTDGIIDHYVNNGAEHNDDTIDDLEYLGFSDIAEQLRKINKLFTGGKPPIDINERNDQLVSWDDEHSDILDEVDKYYWKRNNDLENSLLEHINKTGIGKV
jgi:hypothetical protein